MVLLLRGSHKAVSAATAALDYADNKMHQHLQNCMCTAT
jgi:hypothetical protein